MSRNITNEEHQPLTYPKGGEIVKNSSATGQFDHIQAVFAEPLQIVIYNDDFDRALKIFRAKCQKERILSDYKQHQAFEKPSDKKRRKRNEAIAKAREEERKQQLPSRKKKDKRDRDELDNNDFTIF